MRVTLKGEKELKALALAMRRAKGHLRQEMAAALREPTKKGVEAAKRGILEMPMRGYRRASLGRFPATVGRSTHITQRIARIIEAKVSTSSLHPQASIYVNVNRLEPEARRLPEYFDSGRVFDHPLMGSWRGKVRQSGAPWFYKSIDEEAYVKAVDDGLDRVVEKIEKG